MKLLNFFGKIEPYFWITIFILSILFGFWRYFLIVYLIYVLIGRTIIKLLDRNIEKGLNSIIEHMEKADKNEQHHKK